MSSGASGPGTDAAGEAADWGSPPRVDPLSYPGKWPSESILLTGETHWPLRPRHGQRLGSALVDWTKGAAPPVDAARRRVRLSYALSELDQAAIDHRVPVLAVGSNASPAQLRHKFLARQAGPDEDGADGAGRRVTSVVPMVEAEVVGMKVGVAAQVAPYGALPATPVFGAGLRCRLLVQLLDTHQLRRMDETEGVDNPHGGYDRVYLPADSDTEAPVRVRLPSGEILGGCYAYLAKDGHLAQPSTSPQQPLAAIDQRDQLAHLLAASARLRSELGDTPQAWVDTVWSSPAKMEGTVRRILADEGWAISAGPEVEAAGAIPVTPGVTDDRLYGDLPSYDMSSRGDRWISPGGWFVG